MKKTIMKVAATLSLAAADVTQVQNDAQDFGKILDYQQALKQYKENITTYKDQVEHGVKSGVTPAALTTAPALPVFSTTFSPNIFGRVTKQVQTIKNNKNFTENIGNDLGIVGANPYPTPHTGNANVIESARTDAQKPVLKTSHTQSGRPKLKWEKGHNHAMLLHVDRGDGKGFVLLTVATHHTYTDMSALPAIGATAIWKYRGIFLDNKENQTGQWSEVVQVTVTGV